MTEAPGRGDAARILVIKLGALGDFIQALGPAAAIRMIACANHTRSGLAVW